MTACFPPLLHISIRSQHCLTNTTIYGGGGNSLHLAFYGLRHSHPSEWLFFNIPPQAAPTCHDLDCEVRWAGDLIDTEQ